MTSTVCHRFVQNAWRKERCSNCFKARVEHMTTYKRESSDSSVTRRPPPVVTTINGKSAQQQRNSIMKTATLASRKKHTVSFKTNLSEVIGYGGDEWSDDEDVEIDEISSDTASEDDNSLSSDDKDLDKLTKSNTEQNANITLTSINNNNSTAPTTAPTAPTTTPTTAPTTTTDRRRTFTQLMLGQPLKDSEGRKQTLFVSVTPFGEPNTASRRFNSRSNVSHIPIAAKNKDIFTGSKVVLTSYCKNQGESPEKEESTIREDDYERIVINSDDVKISDSDLVETRNELNVMKNEVELSVSPALTLDGRELSVSPALTLDLDECDEEPVLGENVKFQQQIVKSELLIVQLSTPSPNRAKPASELLDETTTDPEPIEVSSSTSSSEDSGDSLGSTPPAVTREQAGEPDGRADPEEEACHCEPPALPINPPPSTSVHLLIATPPPRASFLHRNNAIITSTPSDCKSALMDKPKVPLKPDNTTITQPPAKNLPPEILPSPLQPQLASKRRAPNPPHSPPAEDVSQPPLPSEPETPEVYLPEQIIPEAVPRKECNVNLLSLEKCERSKEKPRGGRFSLKKLLRVGVGGGGGNKQLEKNRSSAEAEVRKEVTTLKPRLVIVHPLELDGAAVEIVNQTGIGGEEAPPPYGCQRGLPPVPPPRNLSNDKRSTAEVKLPPKSEVLLRQQQQRQAHINQAQTTTITIKQQQLTTPNNNNNNNPDSIYANLGEVRSGLVPSKPQRTASMREREREQLNQQQRRNNNKQQQQVYENHYDQRQENHYEPIGMTTTMRRYSNDSSSDSGSKIQDGDLFCSRGKKCSNDSSELDISSSCGSYYGLNDCEISEGGRPCRLRARKGRSIVHKNLEDNYGAVVVANHEALAQVLEQLHSTTPAVSNALRSLQLAPVLRWNDFVIVDSAPCDTVTSIGRRRTFHHALWGAHHVTLAVSIAQAAPRTHHAAGLHSLEPVTEFNDLVPKRFLEDINGNGVEISEDLVQASISVLPWLQVATIQSIGATLKEKSNPTGELNRDACFILLQFVNSLKCLQAQGIEEIPSTLSNFILCFDVDKDTQHRLCLLQGFSDEIYRHDESESRGSLCACALIALNALFPPTKLATLIRTLLRKESAITLSQVKSILEFSLWGPSDVALGVPIRERELALQRWLDLERATVLHGLVATRVQLSVLEECHLLFLVRSSAKMMCEASLLLEANEAT